MIQTGITTANLGGGGGARALCASGGTLWALEGALLVHISQKITSRRAPFHHGTCGSEADQGHDMPAQVGRDLDWPLWSAPVLLHLKMLQDRCYQLNNHTGYCLKPLNWYRNWSTWETACIEHFLEQEIGLDYLMSLPAWINVWCLTQGKHKADEKRCLRSWNSFCSEVPFS